MIKFSYNIELATKYEVKYIIGFWKINIDIADKGKNTGSKKDPALEKSNPDKTFYLAYDSNSVENPHYHHRKFYPIERMEIINRATKTPQINHITLEVSSKLSISIKI